LLKSTDFRHYLTEATYMIIGSGRLVW